MQTEGGDTTRDALALERALDEALAELPGVDRGGAREEVDYRWLGIGLRLGVERPEHARHLLEMIGVGDSDRAALPQADAGAASPGGGPAPEGPAGTAPVPVLSSILARSAAMPPSDRADVGPEVAFGWAARLTPGEILALGRVVLEMLAAGAPPDIGRGFGLAWDAGVRIPRRERDAMFGEFTELEVTVASVLAERDLRAEDRARPPQGFGALLDQFVLRAGPEKSHAAVALRESGEPGGKGLVALWNVWLAMRYRSLIPRPTFELLVRPWITVVGPLPER
jgi:hypothetical protein